MRTYAKDPEDLLDYPIDYSRALSEGDILTLSTWTLDQGDEDTAPEIEAEYMTDTVATVWLSGGADGKQYVFKNVVVTNDGRNMTRRIKISMTRQ